MNLIHQAEFRIIELITWDCPLFMISRWLQAGISCVMKLVELEIADSNRCWSPWHRCDLEWLHPYINISEWFWMHVIDTKSLQYQNSLRINKKSSEFTVWVWIFKNTPEEKNKQKKLQSDSKLQKGASLHSCDAWYAPRRNPLQPQSLVLSQWKCLQSREVFWAFGNRFSTHTSN